MSETAPQGATAFGAFERMVAARYLRARRKESFVSVIAFFSLAGIAVGVATLIIVMAVMNGFLHEILVRVLGINDHIEVSSPLPMTNYSDLAMRIRQVNGVIEVTPTVVGQAMVTSDKEAGGAQVRGLRAEDLKAKDWIATRLRDGSLDSYMSGEGILIGNRMAERYGVRAGDALTLLAPGSGEGEFAVPSQTRAFTISGIFSVGETTFDSVIIFMPLELAQAFFGYPDQVTNLSVRVSDPEQARVIAADIAGTAPNLRAYSWEQIYQSMFDMIQVQRNVLFLILALIVIVAAFNVISGLIMMVKDKGRDIAILRTMGATRGTIMRIFLLAGTSVGVVGTALGFILGVVFCSNIEAIRQFLQRLTHTELFSPEIYNLTEMPARMEWQHTLLVVVMSLALSLVATLYPSWRAARTEPVEALRYE